MIKFSHSIFALPFALSSMIIAANGFPSLRVTALILICMATARSSAMTFNRIADLKIDSKNPRTKDRHLVKGQLGLPFAWSFLMTNLALFIVSSAMLNRLCLILAPAAIAVIFLYSFTKRWTFLCHFVLGGCLGLAPLGAWIAVRGALVMTPFVIAIGQALWVAGFDILYSLQDIDFDRKEGLKSIPALFGIATSLWISRVCHLIAFAVFFALPLFVNLGLYYFAGIAICGALLILQHSLIKKNDLGRIDTAFFTTNGAISVVFFLGVAANQFLAI